MSNLCIYGRGFLAQSIWNLLLAGVCMGVPLLIHSVQVSLGIFSVVPSDKTMFPEVDSASENEYQGFLLG